MCRICKDKDAYGNHAPDGRCDACAEEHGCDCGCFPSPVLQLQAEFWNDDDEPYPVFEHNGDRWVAHITYQGMDTEFVA